MKIFKKQLSLKQYLTFFAAFIFISLITLIGGEKIYLEVKLYNQGTQISLLEQVNLDLKQQETRLNTLLIQQNTIINDLNRSKNALDLEFSQVIEQTKSIEASLASLLEVSQELEKEIEDLNKKLVSNLIIDNRGQEVRTLNELNLDYDALIAQTRNQISFYQQGISTYTALNQQLTTNNNSLLALIASLNTQISDKQELLDGLVDDLATLNEEITTISLSIATKELEILAIDLTTISDSDLKTKLTNLKNTYDDLLIDKKDVSDEIGDAQAEVTRLQNITVGLQTQYDGLLAAN
jgi:predicted  nucleic acid-binding Zn-ribbon protein